MEGWRKGRREEWREGWRKGRMEQWLLRGQQVLTSCNSHASPGGEWVTPFCRWAREV